jgi:hypothetical protein
LNRLLFLGVTALIAQSVTVEMQRLEVLAQILAVKIWIIIWWHVRAVPAPAAGQTRNDPMRKAWILPDVVFAIFAATNAHRSNETEMSDRRRERA